MKLVRLILPILVASSAGLATCRVCSADEMFPLAASKTSGTKAMAINEGLRVNFGSTEEWPNIIWNAPTDAGWDWSSHEALVLTLTNPDAEAVSFHVKINDHTDEGKKHATQLSGSVPSGATQKFFVSLQPRTLREKSRMRHLPPVTGDYGTSLGSGVEPGHIDQLQIFRSRPSQPATLIIKSIALEGKATTVNLDGIIDQYGQYTRADWPGKVRTDADLLAQRNAEDADLKAHPVLNHRSKWGGWLEGPRQKATGFFRVEQVNGKWWMVDPEGYLFLSVGIDVVRPNLSTIVRGREAMFNWLPKTGEPLAKYGSGNDYDFLRANLGRKYGGDIDATFNDRAMKRLRSWGFNTIGNWTPERLGQEQQFPYVVAMGTRGKFATVPGHKNGKMPDPFDPAFAADVENAVVTKAAQAKHDAACVGYFFDNELPWGMPNVDNEHYVLAYGALSLDATSPAKQAFLGLIKQRYPTVEQLNTAWGTKLTSWQQIEAPFKIATAIKSEAQRTDFSDFLSLYADKYFEVVSSTIKRHDPNHMYLGCRFAFWFTPEAVKASSKYVDAISFNIYSWNRNTYEFAQHLGKPCIVGEFHFGALDRGMFSGNITVKDQQDRGAHYADYVQSVLSEPGFVGCHWFQFYDEPTTGRGSDGENFNIGFVNVTDAPYPELVTAARAANSNIYQWHSESKTR